MAEPKQVTTTSQEGLNIPLVIKRIQQTVVTKDENENENETTVYAPFGVDAKNVELYQSENLWGNLQTFFNNWLNFQAAWEDFVKNGQHIQYGGQEPVSKQVRVWYDTTVTP